LAGNFLFALLQVANGRVELLQLKEFPQHRISSSAGGGIAYKENAATLFGAAARIRQRAARTPGNREKRGAFHSGNGRAGIGAPVLADPGVGEQAVRRLVQLHASQGHSVSGRAGHRFIPFPA
jgi:hypothetical protein